MNVLVLHGPNLNLLGERPGDDGARTLASLDAELRRRAAALGVAVKSVQSNHEGALVDALHAERAWADAVLVSPAELAHGSWVLREALVAVGKPAVEVHLTNIRRRESWRRKSVLKDVVLAQVMGKGFDSYFEALERLAKGAAKAAKRSLKAAERPAVAKTLGRREAAAAPASRPAAVTAAPKSAAVAATPKSAAVAAAPKSAAVAARSAAGAVKSLGRAAPRTATPASDFLSRALVRQKIADRLSGRLSPAGLSTWARSRWLDVQRGAAAESGQRELLEDSLQQLVLSAMPPARLTDEQLIELMTQLDG